MAAPLPRAKKSRRRMVHGSDYLKPQQSCQDVIREEHSFRSILRGTTRQIRRRFWMVRLRRRRHCWMSIASFLLAHAADAAPPLPLVGVARVGYRVADATNAQAFYSRVLGLQRMDERARVPLFKCYPHQDT